MTPTGYRRGAMLRISVQFYDETFRQIAEAAERNGVTFAEQVRVFCEWGLETERSGK
jgi:hypothetical protein